MPNYSVVAEDKPTRAIVSCDLASEQEPYRRSAAYDVATVGLGCVGTARDMLVEPLERRELGDVPAVLDAPYRACELAHRTLI